MGIMFMLNRRKIKLGKPSKLSKGVLFLRELFHQVTEFSLYFNNGADCDMRHTFYIINLPKDTQIHTYRQMHTHPLTYTRVYTRT